MMYGCEKDEPNTPDNPVNKTLLRSISWDNGMEALIYYNNDTTLQKISYSFQSTSDTTVFEWNNKRLAAMYSNRSLYKNTYYYDGNNISHYINDYKNGSSPSTYKMEYAYHTNGSVARLKYFATNESGTELRSQSDYEYNNEGELIKVITTTATSVITHVIENYSAEFDFDPLLFVENGLFENYAIYNVPVMSRMKKYPAKIVRTVKIGNNAAYTDKIQESICDIKNKRIKTMKTFITIPGQPQYNVSVSAIFKYQ